VRFEGDTPLFDKPLVILAFTNRCGSDLFFEYLRNTGVIGGLFEATNEDRVIRRSKNSGCSLLCKLLSAGS
tara:strand:+ start:275 stop:487 length:213 start_codon:yes stop_codon:yes gene_type:complete